MNNQLIKKNRALKYLGHTLKNKKRFIFSKLGHELILIATKACNLNCPFCYDKANISDKNALKKLNGEMSTKQIINLIELCKRLGVKDIRLTGGEAILRRDFFDILKECDGMHVTLCSNGLILEKKLLEIIKIHPEDLHIHLSLEGIKTHYKYRVGSDPYKLIQLAKRIKEDYPKVTVSINTVMNKDNIYELLETYHALKNAKIDQWTISFPRLVPNALEKKFTLPNIMDLMKGFKKLIDEYYKDNRPMKLTFSYFYKFELLNKEKYIPPSIDPEQHPCLPDASGTRGLIVDSFGNVLDCLVLKPLTKKPINLKRILNKKNTSVEEFISKLYASLNSKFYSLKLKNRKDCLNCRYLRLCKGGCPANAYYLLGKFNSTDITSCLMFYYFEKEVLPYLEERDEFESLIDKSKDLKEIEERIEKDKKILIRVGCLN